MSLVTSDLNQVTPEKNAMIPAKTEQSKVASSTAELKSGKVTFKQKPISFENLSETMQEIVSLRGLLEASEGPLVTIPDEHLPLIAKLAHESEKTLHSLAKAIQSWLLPPTLESSQESEPARIPDVLPTSTVEHAVKTVADRVNYGITLTLDKPPAALCVWRWEVKNKEWLPKSVREKACQRFNERVAAKKHLQAMFDDLSEEEKEAIQKIGKHGKVSRGKESGVDTNAVDHQFSPPPSQDEKGETSESHDSSTKKLSRPKKALDAEAIAKEKEKQEKKAIKAEKEKKEAEATRRSAALFTNFFKPGASSSKPVKTISTAPAQLPMLCTSSTAVHTSDFDATFKPFVVKKDARLAPVNWFLVKKRSEEEQIRHGWKDEDKRISVIELDDDGREIKPLENQATPMDMDRNEADISSLSPKDLLHSFLNSQPPSLSPIPHRISLRRASKPEPGHCVREIIHQLSEAEVQGDQRAVRKITALLKNRRRLPAKVFVFAENIRPGYLGTWTKSSQTIGPRTPFARDLLSFDYDHDSDAEWEEGDEGEEGCEDVDSPDESIEDDVSSVGSDLDDWLVEADEIEMEPAKRPDELSLSLPHPNKRKATGTRELPNKKRKVITLIPFQKGPIWETEIGHCEYEPFRPMRIQFINDTPFPLDPFRSVSDSVVLEKPSITKDVDGVFVVPTLPGRLLSTSPASAGPSIGETRAAKRKAANPVPPPKTTFPAAHIPLLLQRVAASHTNSFVILVDFVFQDIKSFGIKKNALEAKLREVAEKDKTRKAWVVKEDAWTRHGLVKPT